MLGRGGAAGRCLQRRPGRQGRRRRAARAPATSRPCLVRRLHAGRALRLRDRHPARQAGAGARRRQEPHGGAARRRPRGGRRRRGVARASARRGSGAWRSRSWSRSTPSPTQLVPPIASRMDGLTHRRRPRGLRHGPAGDRRPPRQGAPPTSTPASRRAPSWSSTAATVEPEGRRPTASGWGPPCSTGSGPACRSTTTRSSVRCCRWCGWRRTTRRWRWSTTTPYGNGTAIFTGRRRRRPPLPARGRGRA